MLRRTRLSVAALAIVAAACSSTWNLNKTEEVLVVTGSSPIEVPK